MKIEPLFLWAKSIVYHSLLVVISRSNRDIKRAEAGENHLKITPARAATLCHLSKTQLLIVPNTITLNSTKLQSVENQQTKITMLHLYY